MKFATPIYPFLLSPILVVAYLFWGHHHVGSPCTQPKPTAHTKTDWIQHWKQNPPCSDTELRNNALALRSSPTNCPTERWYWDWQSKKSSHAFVYIEIGCNKGTDAITNVRAYTGDPSVDVVSWMKHIQMGSTACPMDMALWDRIKRAGRKTGLKVFNLAFSSSAVPATAKFPVIPSGVESVGIDTDHSDYKSFYDVRVTTVDQFVRTEGIRRIDVLKIDTEGNDALVLIGAVKSIMTFKPSYVQFENHGVGHWSKISLKDVIDLLDTLSYDCFWATNDGRLIRITSCWSPSYEKVKSWSNVACSHRDDVLLSKIMTEYVV
ncbi:hypothetical protein GUITHDRAFT_121410 [Guillardia theta CCMP2712]|uniref:Methyltransferase FkbM domain-containing protein n=1 Tax=Guillardia theta (strain CCMP2712) TaxID=905079 RepID=L1I975_GUITC|nr:hypothetical protein GUITHDRAFT_121410 [Guillardia theta CCMP2712]EKX32405.1 hypothetical protein GUITHDRAFT_121410 [Guillardia theta CCMP2712]|eukprot:XP_005819385.1 hypothetical protein GUITHDRAFT_121410 [Guillardia theta CCMP2712]